LVEHLDELRSRLIVSLVALGVAFGICFWQNHALLNLLERPVHSELDSQAQHGVGLAGQADTTQRSVLKIAHLTQRALDILVRPRSGVASASRHALDSLLPTLASATHAAAHVPAANDLLTLGIGEPFTQTVTVSLYFAVILALPVLLFEMYAFVIPAFSPTERSVAMPVMIAVPALLVGGVLFGYFVVLPAAVHFLLGFNSASFDVNVQASSYFPFAGLIMAAMAIIFQLPVAIVAAVRAQIVTTKQLRKNRRIAIAVAAVIAALLPGDAITMILETLPIIVLYEVSILVCGLLDRRDARRARQASRVPATALASAAPPPPPNAPDDAL
jgi:sec-independent protein translocase protein TatC